tara:strand:+ start:413 stop:1063 length:651 start_codon:yes stop_codon:yes gene_type:complete
MRIALIHALPVSIPPIEEAFTRLWPEAETVNLTDDSLAGDLAAAGTLPPEMTDRFRLLARYSAEAGADAILFTCSAFGPCIEVCAADLKPLPVLKPNDALIEECAAIGGAEAVIGLLATFNQTMDTMPLEFETAQPGFRLKTALATKALDLLIAGDRDGHDQAAAEIAAAELFECDVIALAQFSLSPAAALIAERTGRPVLTPPDTSVLKLKRIFT